MTRFAAWVRPEYFFNPGQLWRRLRRERLLLDDEVRLAWGLPITIDPTVLIGFDILNLGTYDRIVPETLCRLLDAGEQAVDAGANIGLTTSILALAAGEQGSVSAFEPHPRLGATLRANVERWRRKGVAPIHVFAVALSNSDGRGVLREPVGFAENDGGATLIVAAIDAGSYEVDLARLDTLFPSGSRIGVLKLDVEDYEAEVLQGAERLLGERAIRDVIFEDLGRGRSDAAPLLESHGYTIYALHAAWSGPTLTAQRDWQRSPVPPDFTHNYLATLDPARAEQRLRRRGWRSLRLRPR